MTNSSKFTISYDATDSDYSKHSIDALQLSESIRAVVDMVTKADKVLNGEKSTVSLKINAPAKSGSLEIGFEAITLLQNAVDVVKLLGLTAAPGAFIGGSVIQLIKHLKSEKIIEIVEDKQTGTTKLITKNQKEHEIDPRIAKLAVDPMVRAAMNALIDKPFEGKEGAKFKILDEKDKPIISIEGNDTNHYVPLPPRSLVETEIQEVDANIHFTQINFDGKSGWKMLYKNNIYTVKMDDDTFLARVKNSKAQFSKDDMFSVTLVIVNTQSPRGSSSSYRITKVNRHRVKDENKII